MSERRIVEPGTSAALVRRLLPDLADVARGPADEHPIAVDQTNTSVVVGDTVIVKWFFPPPSLPHHGVELLAQLSERGFERTPRLLAVETVDGHVDAIVTEYLRDARDGWDWYCALAEWWCASDDPVDAIADRAGSVGRLTADMHHALVEVPVASATESIERIRADATALLDEALAVDADVVDSPLPAREGAIRDVLDRFGDVGETPVAVQAVHGDFHVGQILLAADELWVIDFDGDPVVAAADRHRPQPVVRDLASILQALDHVGRVADKRLGFDRSERVERFIGVSIDAALDAYRRRLRELDSAVVVDERLLLAFRIAQELHELVYAARHLPHWRYVADAALPALLEDH